MESTMSRIKPTFHSVIECMMCTSVIGIKFFNYCICKLVHMLCFSWFQMCRNMCSVAVLIYLSLLYYMKI